MLLRTFAVLVSLFAHGLFGYALWPGHSKEELEILDVGSGHDIELTPQGLAVDEVTNVGDNIESLEAEESVPLAERQPKPQPPVGAMPDELGESADEVIKKLNQDVAALKEEKPASQASEAPSPVEIRDVRDDVAKQTVLDTVAVREQNPLPQSPVVASTDQVDDVDAVENKSPQEVEVAREERIAPPRPALQPTEQLHNVAAPEKNPVQQSSESASETSLPDPLKPLASAKAGTLPVPDQLKELTAAKANESSPPEPVEEPKPEETVLAQPEQVALVREQSSGEVKSGGDARVVGIYLGQVNAQVQRSKINPRSRQTGVVILKFTVGTDGSLLSKQVASSSGFQVLDDAALAAIERAAPFPAVPMEVSADPMTFTQLFRFVVR